MRVTELEAPLLNYWVAKAEGLERAADAACPTGFWHPPSYHPATDWSQGGPIVARAWPEIEECMAAWFGPRWPHLKIVVEAPLKWFMRCHVAVNFGDEVEDELPDGVG